MPDRPRPRHLASRRPRRAAASSAGLHGAGAHAGRRASSARVYRRRRLAVGASALALLAVLVLGVAGLAGHGPWARHGGSSAAAPAGGAPAGAGPSAVAQSSAGGEQGSEATAAGTRGVPHQGRGVFDAARRPRPDSNRPGPRVTWTVEVERGLGIDPDTFARAAADILLDRRGWEREDRIRFVYVPQHRPGEEDVQVRLTLASPATTDRLCAPAQTMGRVSCANRGRAVINAKRWVVGAYTYPHDLAGYRTYVVNHEVGHLLGYDHEPCARRGGHAPLMLQQTLTLQGCRRWPYPVGDGTTVR